MGTGEKVINGLGENLGAKSKGAVATNGFLCATMIWEYNSRADETRPITEALRLRVCLFCNSEMTTLLRRKRASRESYWIKRSTGLEVKVCSTCGWWQTLRRTSIADRSRRMKRRTKRYYEGNIAQLRKLDVDDLTTPLEEIKNFLLAKYESRYDLNPRLFEETVASVFQALGYQARVTAYSNDGGIDVVLDGPEGREVGVQVKRYKDAINVEHIRAFTGALLIGGYTKGIFVTTSRFQSGANKTADVASVRGIPIELMDADRFYDALRLAKRELYSSTEDFIKYLRARRYLRADFLLPLASFSPDHWI